MVPMVACSVVVSAAVSISSLPHADSVSAAASATAAIALRRNAFINLSFGLVFVVKRLGPLINCCALNMASQSELMLNFWAQGQQS
jgi:hypothetical protein